MPSVSTKVLKYPKNKTRSPAVVVFSVKGVYARSDVASPPKRRGLDRWLDKQTDKLRKKSTNPIVKKTDTIIKLYLPKITVPLDMQYDSANLGFVGGHLAKGGTLLGSVTSEAGQFVSALSKEMTGDNAQRAAQVVAGRQIFGEGSSREQGIKIAARLSANPHTRSLFNSVQIRSFTYTFSFFPESRDEAEVVDNIITTFRAAAHPNVIGSDIGAPLYSFPNVFGISYRLTNTEVGNFITSTLKKRLGGVKKKFSGNDKEEDINIIHKIKDCYLVSASLDPTPTTAAFFKDGYPVEQTITLTFNESTTLSKADILAGY